VPSPFSVEVTAAVVVDGRVLVLPLKRAMSDRRTQRPQRPQRACGRTTDSRGIYLGALRRRSERRRIHNQRTDRFYLGGKLEHDEWSDRLGELSRSSVCWRRIGGRCRIEPDSLKLPWRRISRFRAAM
jgi:hypothetical protein